ncbi:MAG: DUF6460 domain-containing protein, partial [Pseudomonadota bacterium]
MSEIHKRSGSVERVLGGSPLGVAIRLVIMSFIVGVILRALDLNPADIFVWAETQLRYLSSFGFDTFEQFGGIMLLGAVVVVPIWLVL